MRTGRMEVVHRVIVAEGQEGGREIGKVTRLHPSQYETLLS